MKQWIGLERIEGSSKTAVKTSFVKSYLRIDYDYDDALIKSMILAATASIEEHLQRSILTTEWKMTRENFSHRVDGHNSDRYNNGGVIEATKNDVYNEQDYLYLPMGRAQSIISLVTYNDGNIPATFDATRYYLDNSNGKGRLVLNDQDTWPTDLRSRSAIEVSYISGFGDSDKDLPEDIKLAITMIVGTMYEDRCTQANVSPMAASMLSKYKIYSLG